MCIHRIKQEIKTEVDKDFDPRSMVSRTTIQTLSNVDYYPLTVNERIVGHRQQIQPTQPQQRRVLRTFTAPIVLPDRTTITISLNRFNRVLNHLYTELTTMHPMTYTQQEFTRMCQSLFLRKLIYVNAELRRRNTNQYIPFITTRVPQPIKDIIDLIGYYEDPVTNHLTYPVPENDFDDTLILDITINDITRFGDVMDTYRNMYKIKTIYEYEDPTSFLACTIRIIQNGTVTVKSKRNIPEDVANIIAYNEPMFEYTQGPDNFQFTIIDQVNQVSQQDEYKQQQYII